MPSGWDPLLGRYEIGGFGARALDDMLQITDYCPKGVDGVIVTVVHDEFRGWGFRACRSFWVRGRRLMGEFGVMEVEYAWVVGNR